MWGTDLVFEACTASPESHLGHKRLENPYGIKTFTRFELKRPPSPAPKSHLTVFAYP